MSDPSASQRVTIINEKGLHARASAKFAKLACTYVAKVEVSHDEVTASARSIMDLLMLTAHMGVEIEIVGKGEDAAEAVTALSSLVASGFGELDEDEPPAAKT
ncbi:MAG: HPr family phosphocarrier protein [Hyphomonadaceae bacterium]